MERVLRREADVAEESPAALPAARRDFLGVPIDCLTLGETADAAEAAMRSHRPLRQVSINVAKFVAMRQNPELDCDVRSSDLVSVDGMGILWAARLLGLYIPERVAGIDLFEAVLARCAAGGYRPYFLGAQPDVLARAVAAAQSRHPGLVFAGSRNGYFGDNEEGGVVAAITAAQADCLFIGMPTPRKERFLARHGEALGIPFVMGVGGSFDVLAGAVRRAPAAVRAIGLEWLFRLAQEPLRLGPRYLKTNAAFAAILTRALVAKLFRSEVHPACGRSARLGRRP
ncbi:MAG TPA: WecB/TagA/CpsF family glycosyltransferase [Stellaceae bacterium]|jgi:N-acetylglucosaminyldiphosphoundecaprenol N-acetyl-beta-D-mannosaminyltransferase|nr:WecB/TagA/CpsF family glycosyltransferase [Stellaceae bacterium]